MYSSKKTAGCLSDLVSLFEFEEQQEIQRLFLELKNFAKSLNSPANKNLIFTDRIFRSFQWI